MIKQLSICALLVALTVGCSKKDTLLQIPKTCSMAEAKVCADYQPALDIHYPKSNFDPSILGFKISTTKHLEYANGQQNPSTGLLMLKYYDYDGDNILDAITVNDWEGKLKKIALVVASKAYIELDKLIDSSTYKVQN